MRLENGRLAVFAGLVGGALAVSAWRRAAGFDFRNRAVVITGGSRGLGLVMAREFAKEGARLAILARDELALERARRDLTARGADVLALACDVRRRGEVRAAVEAIAARYEGIDILVNNAGIVQVGPLEHMQLDDFEDAMAVHFWGPLYAMRAVLPHMIRQGGGRIVNISSIGGKLAVPHLTPYCASKFALAGLSEGFAAELARRNIRVTTVYPGLMRTGSPPNALFKGQHRAEFSWFAISDALPCLTISAPRAARQIVEACRRGRAELVITPQARLADLLHGALPGLTVRAMQIANRLLPHPNGPIGDDPRPGRESRSPVAPSLLTRLNDRAAAANNQLG